MCIGSITNYISLSSKGLGDALKYGVPDNQIVTKMGFLLTTSQ